MNILKRSGFHDESAGTLEAKSRKKMGELLDMADEELKQYGNPPQQVTAEFTDGDGHVYRGTLYLVSGEQV